MKGFAVAAMEPLSLERGPKIRDMYALSPFVWEEGGGFSMLLRVVPNEADAAKKIARIHYGRAEDGLHFVVDDDPAIAPGPGAEDLHGCEDPTVVSCPDGYYVFYTGWNEEKKEGQLMLAKGPNIWRLNKVGPVLRSDRHRNPKEATVVATGQGDWRMFFEFASDEASHIGVARAEALEGPWRVVAPLCAQRPDRWDGWHVSTGPVWQREGGPPVMFYNGANEKAHWRIGWLTLDETYTSIVDRADHPIIMPPVPTGDATDIAFAASCVAREDIVQLYYSIADKEMVRATLRPIWG